MSYKTTILSAGALFFSAFAIAQHHGEEGHIHTLACGVPDISYEEIQATNAMVAQIKAEKKVLNSTSSDGITYIPVKMHLFGNDDNTDFTDETQVNDMLAELNKIYRKNQKFEFFFAGTSFNKYANSTMNNRGNGTTSAQEIEFNKNNGATDAINFYVARSLRGTGGYSWIRPTSQTHNFLYVVTGQLNDNKTTPHEFGHYFGLAHTFNNSHLKNTAGEADYTRRELVTRNFNETAPRLSANCNRTGDTFCDTPADPYGNGATSVANCVVTGTPDANGDNFAPSMGNYMNYYWCGPYNFSPQQISYMTDGYILMNNRTTSFTASETSQSAPTDLKALVGPYNGSIQLSWKDNSNVETGYIIEVAEAGTTDFVPIAGVKSNVETYKLTELLDTSKKYVFRVKPSNSKAIYSETSETFEIPKLCASSGTTNCANRPAVIINNVILTKGNEVVLSNTNSACTGEATVNYFDTHIAKVNAGDVLDFKVEPTYGNGGSYYPADVKLFCDWNNDGDFDDENEALGTESSVYRAIGKFKIPENTPTGKYRLRVVLSHRNRAITACNAQGGEMEDYALEVTNATLSTSEAVANKAVSFYPNPVSTQINLQNAEQYVSYEIYDASGRIVKNGRLVTTTINVNELSNGVYTLSLIDKKGQKSIARFIKKK